MIGDLIDTIFQFLLNVCFMFVDVLERIVSPIFISIFGSNITTYFTSISTFVSAMSHVWSWVVDFSLIPPSVFQLIEFYFLFSITYWIIMHPLRTLVNLLVQLF